MNSRLRGLMSGKYRPLDINEVEAIHQVSVRVLEETGVRVANREALEVFAGAGAPVDYANARVRIPRSMLEEAIAAAPARVLLCGRDERHDMILEHCGGYGNGGDSMPPFRASRTYMGTGGTVLNVLDLETGQHRPATLQDLKDTARLADALENIHFFMLPVYPRELTGAEVDINRFWWGMANTSKHIMGGVYTIAGIREVVKIATEVSRGTSLRERPIISMVTCVMSPLIMDDTYTGLLMEVARQGIPVVCPAEPLAGATGPVTLAGTVAISNAETLSGVVLAQLVNPGTPVIYGTVASIIDMKSAAYLSGAVETGLINAASAQMARYYGLPVYATAGMSDSKVPDVQAGYEKGITAVLVALAGANFIHDAAGFLEFCTTLSYEQMVIDDEIIGLCMRAVQGITVNENTLAEEVIKTVGPAGNYLTKNHTLRNYRRELYFPPLADRQNRRAWEDAGSRDAAARAREKAKKILAEHVPLPIDQEVTAIIKARFPRLFCPGS